MSEPKPSFTWPIRIYFEDTDVAGIVYHPNYLKYFERARTEWMRTLEVDMRDIAHQNGLVFIVNKAKVDYLSPCFLNDALEVVTQVDKCRAASLVFRQRLYREQNRAHVLSDALVSVVCVDKNSYKPSRIPEPVLRKLKSVS